MRGACAIFFLLLAASFASPSARGATVAPTEWHFSRELNLSGWSPLGGYTCATPASCPHAGDLFVFDNDLDGVVANVTVCPPSHCANATSVFFLPSPIGPLTNQTAQFQLPDGNFTKSAPVGRYAFCGYPQPVSDSASDWKSCVDHAVSFDVASLGGNAPPSVAIDTPREGTTVAGTVNVTGTASDTDGDAVNVTLTVDGGVIGSTTVQAGAWTIAWDTHGFADAPDHQLRAIANDGHTDSTMTPNRVVAVNNTHPPRPNHPPAVAISFPSSGAMLLASGNATGTAKDPDNDALALTASLDAAASENLSLVAGHWSYFLNLSRLGEGNHTLVVRADDGKSDTTASVTFRAPPPPPPRKLAVFLLSPASGRSVNGTVRFFGLVLGGVKPYASVLLTFGDGTPLAGIVNGSNWSATWDTTRSSTGRQDLSIVATDDAGTSSPPATAFYFVERSHRTNPAPSVAFDQPVPESVGGVALINGTAHDPDGEAVLVTVSVDGNPATGVPLTRGRWTLTWDTRAVGDGTHTLVAHAADAGGETQASARFTVKNSATPTPPPTGFGNGSAPPTGKTPGLTPFLVLALVAAVALARRRA